MRTKILLLIIVLVAAVLRFVALDKVPVSPYWDEVAIGYNAYSIAHTGKDEYGKAFPLLFQSYDDYKMPGQIYLSIIPIALFGLNIFSTRFISAFLGTVSVFVFYFLVKALFDREYREKQHYKFGDMIAITSTFLLAISPWHIQFSRASFEANSGLFFILLAAWLFIKGLDSGRYRLLSFISFAASCYFYRSILVFVPLVLIADLLIFHKDLFAQKARKASIMGIIVFVLLVIPVYYATFVGNGFNRAEQVSVSTELSQKVIDTSEIIGNSPVVKLGKIALNRRFVMGEDVLHNYLTNFSFDFLFFSGDPNMRHSPREMGTLYLWEMISLLAGALMLLRLPWKIGIFIGSWILFAPIPAALSLPVPHALRSLNAAPMFALISAIGLISLFVWIQNKRFKIVYSGVAGIVILFFFVQYLYLYFAASPRLEANDWGYGYQQLVQAVTSQQNRYKKIVITGYQWEPSEYFLFYTRYDPVLYQQSGSMMGFSNYIFGGAGWDIARYHTTFEKINLKKFAGTNNALYVLSPLEYKQQIKVTSFKFGYKLVRKGTIYDMNHQPLFIFVIVTKRKLPRSSPLRIAQ
ncbi:MAG TPA: glycosyltransferase family 39 protein [Candidatus Acidoferrales bacterium]|nr:glycosyltransferase family 39 protein [Candidatus Acidoferrales bacterium]